MNVLPWWGLEPRVGGVMKFTTLHILNSGSGRLTARSVATVSITLFHLTALKAYLVSFPQNMALVMAGFYILIFVLEIIPISTRFVCSRKYRQIY